MVVFTPEAPVPENQLLRDIEKALAEFRGFEMTPEQRGILAKYLLSKVEIRKPQQKK